MFLRNTFMQFSGNCRCLVTVCWNNLCYFTQYRLCLCLTHNHPYLYCTVLFYTRWPSSCHDLRFGLHFLAILSWFCSCSEGVVWPAKTFHLLLRTWSEWFSPSAAVARSIAETFILLPSLPLSLDLLVLLLPFSFLNVRSRKKKSTLAHLHAERLGSSCEQGIEMEMGRGERADYAPQTHALPPGWPTSWVEREREKGTWVSRWVGDEGLRGEM